MQRMLPPLIWVLKIRRSHVLLLPPILIWVIVWYRVKWQGKQNSKKQHWVSCPGRAIITMDPIQPKIALMSFWARAAVEASPWLQGVTHGGSHRMPSSCQRLTFAGQQTHCLLAALTSPLWKRCPRGLEGRSTSQTLTVTASLVFVSNPLSQTIFFFFLFFSIWALPNERGHNTTTPWSIFLFILCPLHSHLWFCCPWRFIYYIFKESFLVILELVISPLSSVSIVYFNLSFRACFSDYCKLLEGMSYLSLHPPVTT